MPPATVQYHSHPDHQQDRWVVERVFHGKRDGFFVEAGAGGHSNTETLERDFGWKGLAVEPLPERFAEVQRKRNCHLEQVCLADERKQLTFLINDDAPGTSGLEETLGEGIRQMTYANNNVRKLVVDAVPLWELLDKITAPTTIDYLSLDVEGAEWMVLRDFPFDRYCFRCMTIERGAAEYLQLRKLILSLGYRLVRVGSADDFFIHVDQPYTIPLADRLAAFAKRTVQAARGRKRSGRQA